MCYLIKIIIISQSVDENMKLKLKYVIGIL